MGGGSFDSQQRGDRVEQPRPVRINLATPLLGRRMAGTALPTRGEESVRRFIAGFATGAALTAAVSLAAAALGVLAPTKPADDRWGYVLEQELARVEGELHAPLARAVRLGTSLRALASIPGADDVISGLLGIDLPTPEEERAARLLAMDTRARLVAELRDWEARLDRIAAAPPATAASAVRVLSLLRWQVEGGELTRSLQGYERDVAVAFASLPTATPVPTPSPTPRKRR